MNNVKDVTIEDFDRYYISSSFRKQQNEQKCFKKITSLNIKKELEKLKSKWHLAFKEHQTEIKALTLFMFNKSLKVLSLFY